MKKIIIHYALICLFFFISTKEIFSQQNSFILNGKEYRLINGKWYSFFNGAQGGEADPTRLIVSVKKSR